MLQKIKSYYTDLAPDYDEDRFNNSYGRYIDAQEQAVLRSVLRDTPTDKVLDLACGTGRFLTFADTGVDVSAAMLEEAAKKYPDKKLVQANALDFVPEKSYQAIICFHLIMHLEAADLAQFLRHYAAFLPSGGSLVFDIPSAERRQLLSRKRAGWHGANAYTDEQVRHLCKEQWVVSEVYGIAMLPVHRLPKQLRNYCWKIDAWLGRTFLKMYASYRIYHLQRSAV